MIIVDFVKFIIKSNVVIYQKLYQIKFNCTPSNSGHPQSIASYEVGRNSFPEINFLRKTFPAFSTKILLHEVKTNLATAVIYDHPAIQQSLTVRLQPSSNRTKNKKNAISFPSAFSLLRR